VLLYLCLALNADSSNVNSIVCQQSPEHAAAATESMDCTESMDMLTDVVSIINTDLANAQVISSNKVKRCL